MGGYKETIKKLARMRALDAKTAEKLLCARDGGKGSGNFGHKGRPGKVGGSGGGGGSAKESTGTSPAEAAIKSFSEKNPGSTLWNSRGEKAGSSGVTNTQRKNMKKIFGNNEPHVSVSIYEKPNGNWHDSYYLVSGGKGERVLVPTNASTPSKAVKQWCKKNGVSSSGMRVTEQFYGDREKNYFMNEEIDPKDLKPGEEIRLNRSAGPGRVDTEIFRRSKEDPDMFESELITAARGNLGKSLVNERYIKAAMEGAEPGEIEYRGKENGGTRPIPGFTSRREERPDSSSKKQIDYALEELNEGVDNGWAYAKEFKKDLEWVKEAETREELVTRGKQVLDIFENEAKNHDEMFRGMYGLSTSWLKGAIEDEEYKINGPDPEEQVDVPWDDPLHPENYPDYYNYRDPDPEEENYSTMPVGSGGAARKAGEDMAKRCADIAKSLPDGEEKEIYEKYAKVLSNPQPGRPTSEESKALTEQNLGNISEQLKPYAVSRYKNDLEHEPQITSDICDIADMLGTEMYGLGFRLKKASNSKDDGKCRIAEKIADDMKDKPDKPGLSYEKAVDKLGDIVRYTQACTTDNLVENFEKTREELEKRGYKAVKVKNSWDSYNLENAYRGVNCVFETPDGKTKFELQFHTPESFVTKEVNHPEYEEQRKNDTPKKRKDELGLSMYNRAKKMKAPKSISKIKNYP